MPKQINNHEVFAYIDGTPKHTIHIPLNKIDILNYCLEINCIYNCSNICKAIDSLIFFP
ncbi:hypothetical protein MtrunA17_Chr7g0254881 [Medicago truncatula]|uniref:Uncharacterized protein n=1 Tax=Medicago truncatula TaxID=3880 RepID=A0A396H4E7_MEDTR|nr:hypothetical protein MtrunA17_Chr7g0254881 [Medicago truncatula]